MTSGEYGDTYSAFSAKDRFSAFIQTRDDFDGRHL